MEGQTGAFLIVEKSEPYRRGEILPLREAAVLLARTWGGNGGTDQNRWRGRGA